MFGIVLYRIIIFGPTNKSCVLEQYINDFLTILESLIMYIRQALENIEKALVNIQIIWLLGATKDIGS